MQVIKPSYEIVNSPDWDEVMMGLERAIRTCYKSEKKIDVGTAEKLIRSIISRGHESTLEHYSMTVRFICDRGVSHELVRHRHGSFSQESTRYVNYSPEGNNNEGEMQFILPPWVSIHAGSYHEKPVGGTTPGLTWLDAMKYSCSVYNKLVSDGWKPEEARSVLPNSLKTEIVVTTNMRDWRHLLGLRCDKTAHPQMRELMRPLLDELKDACPALFDSVEYNK